MTRSSRAGGARAQTLALLAAVFVAGGLAGAAIERLRSPEGAPEGRGRFMTPPGEIPDFYERLDLTAEQRARIEEIIDSRRPETDSLLRIAMPRLRRLTDATRAAIREVLTDEQRARLDERFQRSRDGARGRERGGRDGREREPGRAPDGPSR